MIEALPTTLPPLRGDAPTLIVGRLKDGQALNYTLEGTVAGRPVEVNGSEPVGEAEADNFFLIGMIEQWKNAKDQPALSRADRLLAAFSTQTQMARADLIAQAEWAMGQDKLEVAKELFDKAQRLDPEDTEARAGLKIVQKLRNGLINKKQLHEQLVQAEKEEQKQVAQNTQKPAPPPDVAPPVDQGDLLEQQKAREKVEQQRVTGVVDEAQRQARRILTSDPDEAHDILKRMYNSVRDNPDIGDQTRLLLLNRLETALRSVDTAGVRIKSERARQLQAEIDARRRADVIQSQVAEDERLRARMRQFSNLMNQARYEDAYLQALAVEQDAINAGRPVPVAATAGYMVGLNANNLSQIQELRRVREERFLLTMMQVERSAVPFPDEPPIQYPPAAVWREITRMRKERYESSGFTEDDPLTIQAIRRMREKLSKPISLDKAIDKNTPLKDALEFLSDRYDLTILIDTPAFKQEQVDNVEDLPVGLPRMSQVSLSTVLRLLSG
ncbi:MAG: hypothetical protein E6K70_25685, partial [Planctomycetota bacterium]